MSPFKTIGLIAIIILIILGFSSIFTVQQGHEALLLRFGKMQVSPKTDKTEVFQPGLHFKVPFIEQAEQFDTRLQTFDMKSSRVITTEKKYLIVDYYVKWRIGDLPLYFTRTSGNTQQAQNLLQQQLNNSLRAQFGRRTIPQVVSDDRSEVMNTLLQDANKTANVLGMKVVDVRIKRIDLPEETSNSVYQRMRAERERVATEYRSRGKAQAEKIRAAADANVTVTIATAKEQAAKIRAQGQALAATVYNNAYTQNPKFYAFYRSMLAYQQAFAHKKDILVLQPDSQFFNYFNQAGNKRSAATVVKRDEKS